MNWKAKLSLSSFLLLPVIILGTVLVWLFAAPTKPVSDAFLQSAPYQQQHGWRVLIPNLNKAKVFVLDRPHEPEELKHLQMHQQKRIRKFHISTNEQGMRNPPLQTKSQFRILCVGESITFGWGVNTEDSYPAQLGKILDVEAINVGIPSSGLSQNTYWIQKFAKDFDPDLILLTIRPDWGHRNDLKQIARTVQETRRQIRPIPLGVVVSAISSFDRRGNEVFLWDEDQVKKTLRGIPVLELTSTFRKQKTENGVRLKIHNDKQQLIDVNTEAILVEAPNIPLVHGQAVLAPAIIQAFEDNPKWHEPMIFDAGHPDEKGYSLMAKTIAQWIEKNRWLPQDVK